MCVSRLIIAADVSVTLTADQTQVSLEDPIEITVSIRGSRQAPEPKILHLENFEVSGRSSSSSVNIVNQSVSVETGYRFNIFPKKPGKFPLGPATVEIDGQEYKSNAIQIHVNQQGNPPTQNDSSRPYYIVTEVDNETPYANEQITYTFRLFTRLDMTNGQLGLPEFQGFWKESMGKNKEYRKVLNGIEWRISEVKTALFPLRAGTIEIDAASLQGNVVSVQRRRRRRDNFFDEFFFGGARTFKPVRLRSKPVQVTVKPLPVADKPTNFSGLVGQFELESEISKTTLAVGESATLTLSIRGNGNVRDVKLNPPNSADFKVYEDAPLFETGTNGSQLIGTKTFRWAIVPAKEGPLELPQVEIPYFDPQSRVYRRLSSQFPTLNIQPGSGETLTHVAGSKITSNKKAISIVGKDLMPIQRRLSGVEDDTLSMTEKLFYWLIWMLMPVLYGTVRFFKLKRAQFLSDSGSVRRSKAYRSFQTALKTKFVDQNGKTHTEASRALRTYLGDKLNFDGKAITSDEIRGKLQPHRVSDKSISELKNFLQQCEQAEYGGASASMDPQETKNKLLSLVKQLEKEIRV